MKNILNKHEFRQLKELQMMKESMDFSNKTGWSDSLVGRAINKLFSFGARQVQMVILNNLKTKIDDQYLLAILDSLAKNKAEIKEGANNMAEISVTMTNKNTKKELTLQRLSNAFTFKILKDTKKEDYEIVISSNVKSSWKIGEVENAQITEIVSLTEVAVTSESGDAHQTYTINVEGIAQGQGQVQVKPQTQQITKGPKYELAKVVDVSKEINQVQELTDEQGICYGEYDYALMTKLKTEIESEITNIREYLSLMETTKEDVPEEWINNKESDKKLLEKMESLPAVIEKKMSTVEKKETPDDEKLKLVINGLSEDATPQKFQELVKIKDEMITKNPANKEKAEQFINRAETVLGEKNYKGYSNYQRFRAFDIAHKGLVEMVTENLSTTEYDMIFEKYMTEFDNMQLIKESNTKIKDLFKDYKKTAGVEEYADKDAASIDMDDIKAKFDANPQMRTDAINSVNKEALKEIALKAQWMYDTEKYEDKRNTHYSRVNFTTTNMDQKKLENKWLQLVSKAKSTFAPFFSVDNKMPPELDPIALIKSDETFRKEWNQYGIVKAAEDPNNTGNNPQDNTGPETLAKLKLKYTESLSDGYGMIVISTYGDKLTNLGMLVKKSSKEIESVTLTILKFIGLFDYAEIKNGVVKGEKLEDLIEKYNYSGIDKITNNNPDLDINKKSLLLDFYNQIRPTAWFKKHQLVKETKQVATFYFSNINPAKKNKSILQVNSFGETNDKTYVSPISTVGVKISDPIMIDNFSADSSHAKYNFWIFVHQVAQLSDENKKYYTDVDEATEIVKSNYVLNNDSVLKKIKDYYKINKN